MLEISDIASQLQNPSTVPRIVPVLRYISSESQKANVSSLEKNQLIHISKNLTRSISGFDTWCGVNILGALLLDRNFCVQKGAEVLDLLCNTVGKNVTDRMLLRSCLRCIERVLRVFWLDVSLSREILTQRLPILIGLCSTALSRDPGVTSRILQSIITHHPTTSRPFINQLYKLTFGIIKTGPIDCLPFQNVLILPPTVAMVEKEEPQKRWSAYLTSILYEMVLTFSIFENFVNIGEIEYMRAMFENVPISDRVALFPPLQIEASSSSSLMQISERFKKLISILEVTLASHTSDSVQIPVGRIMKITEVILSLNIALCHFKAHFRGDKAKDVVLQNLLEVQNSLFNVIRSLEARLKGFVVPYSHRLLELYEHQARCFRRYKSDHSVTHLDFTMLIEAAGALMCLVGFVPHASHIASVVTIAIDDAKIGIQSHAKISFHNSKDSLMHNFSKIGRQSGMTFFDKVSRFSSVPHTTIGIITRQFLEQCILFSDSFPGQDTRFTSDWSQILLNLANNGPSSLPLLRNLKYYDDLASVTASPRFPGNILRVQSEDFDSNGPDHSGNLSSKRILSASPALVKKAKLEMMKYDAFDSNDNTSKRSKIELTPRIDHKATATFELLPIENMPSNISFSSEDEDEIEIPTLQMETESEDDSQ